MDKNTLTELIVAQTKPLYDTAVRTYGSEHVVTFALSQVLAAVGEDADALVETGNLEAALAAIGEDVDAFVEADSLETVLAAFANSIEAHAGAENADAEENYNVQPAEGVTDADARAAFEKIQNIIAAETSEDDDEYEDWNEDTWGEDEDLQEDDADGVEYPEQNYYGVIPTASGDVEFGDRANFELANEAVAEEGEVNIIEIVYTREDGAGFSRDQLTEVVEHPVSVNGLRLLGVQGLVSVEQANDSTWKTRWFVQNGELNAAAIGRVASYRGTYDFDGIGAVSCNSFVVLNDEI